MNNRNLSWKATSLALSAALMLASCATDDPGDGTTLPGTNTTLPGLGTTTTLPGDGTTTSTAGG